MTQDFAIKAITLACCHLQESHTAVNIEACLTEIVKEWSLDLSNRPVYVGTYIGRNIRAAVRQMEWIPLQCLGHTLQLAIKDAKEDTPVVSLLCKKARALVRHYKQSAQAIRRLKDCQKRMELPSIGLIPDVDTRWNSEHAMLSRLVHLRDAVSLEIATSETSVSCLSLSEWNVAASLVQILQPIADATTDLSGLKYGTMCYFFTGQNSSSRGTPTLKTATPNSSACSYIANKAKNLLKSLESRFPLYAERK
ncbi:hypothetical protein HPB49_017600 [Dermacentor silvarum]|uniref:Uncharacterized protein n=1 Tax=Dermacentor silvarum TaxID=543639 RepID=A0ACB8E1X9_DERSI|nr:hypothetical protein HPB49_017600 [Dermacentor silvarum]